MRWINKALKRDDKPDKDQADRRKSADAGQEDFATRHAHSPSSSQGHEGHASARELKELDENVARRARRAAESLLENESLTADLDDAAASKLLKWGTQLVKDIASETVGMDDEQADQVTYARMRATRKMMRSVNKLIAGRNELDAEGKLNLLVTISENMALIQGTESVAPDPRFLQAFLNESDQETDSAQFVLCLRSMFEPPLGSI